MYPDLPEQLPIHWDAAGRADEVAPRAWGAWLLPVVAAALAALLALLPRISPRGYRLEGSRRVLGRLSMVLVAFLGFVQLVVLSQSTASPLGTERWVPAALGLMLALLGNSFGKTTKNFFVGIRTPWTLASDEVWLRTHRRGGKLFVSAGAVVFVAALAGRGAVVIPVAIGLAALLPSVYSYWLYRRIEGLGPDAI